MRTYNKSWVYFLLSVVLLIIPFIGSGEGINLPKEYAAEIISTSNILNPSKWFEVIKRNITIPIPKGKIINIPTPEEALKGAAPQLLEINRGVEEETGIDIAKFIGWMAKVLKIFFQFIIDILKAVSGSFS